MRSYNYKPGAHHTDEMGFVFGATEEGGILHDNATLAEQALARSVMHAWTTFARTG